MLITLNYQTFYLHMIASKVIYQHHFVIVLQQTSPYFRNQEANQVNIRTVRTKTTVSNNIKSKSANIWKFLQIFINRLFYNGLCLQQFLYFLLFICSFFVSDFCRFYFFLYLCISWFYLVLGDRLD